MWEASHIKRALGTPLRVQQFAYAREPFRHFAQRVIDPQRKCLTTATASPRRRKTQGNAPQGGA